MILFRPSAARELAADVRYYDERYAGRGQRFAEAVERTFSLIVESPRAFPVFYAPDIRSAKVARFPYRVVYGSSDPTSTSLWSRMRSGGLGTGAIAPDERDVRHRRVIRVS